MARRIPASRRRRAEGDEARQGEERPRGRRKLASVARLRRAPSLEIPGEPRMIRYAKFVTPLGTMIATAARGALTGLYFEGGRHAPPISRDWKEDPPAPPIAECNRHID